MSTHKPAVVLLNWKGFFLDTIYEIILAIKTLNKPKLSLVPALYLDSKILNKFGDKCVNKIGIFQTQ